MDCGENCPVTTTSSNWLISSLTSMFGNTFSRPVSMVTGNSLRWAVTDWTTIVYSPGGAANSKLPSPSDIPPNTVFFSETVMYSAGAPSAVMTLPEILTFTRFCPAAGRTDNNNRMTVQIFLIMGFWFYSFAKVGGMKRAGNHPFWVFRRREVVKCGELARLSDS